MSSPDGATVALDGISGSMEGVNGSVRFLALANAAVTAARSAAPAARCGCPAPTSVTVLISIGTSYVNYRTVNGDYQGIARSRLNAARSVAVDQLRSRHVADYQALFDRVTIDLGRTAAADQPTDVRIAQHASTERPAVRRAAVPVRALPADLLVAAGHPAGEPPGHLERLADAVLGLEVHGQRQPADELLAGRHHEPVRVLPAGLRHGQGPHGHRRAGRPRRSTAPAAGSPTTTPTPGGARRSWTARSGACGRPAGPG